MKHFSKITLSLSALILAIFLAACSTEADSTNTKTESYVITFNPNGGTIITKKQTIEGNKEANIASASALGLSYNSMKFLGWALTSSANEATYGDGAKIILSENITLYAVWKDTSAKLHLAQIQTPVTRETILNFQSNLKILLKFRAVWKYMNQINLSLLQLVFPLQMARFLFRVMVLILAHIAYLCRLEIQSQIQ